MTDVKRWKFDLVAELAYADDEGPWVHYEDYEKQGECVEGHVRHIEGLKALVMESQMKEQAQRIYAEQLATAARVAHAAMCNTIAHIRLGEFDVRLEALNAAAKELEAAVDKTPQMSVTKAKPWECPRCEKDYVLCRCPRSKSESLPACNSDDASDAARYRWLRNEDAWGEDTHIAAVGEESHMVSAWTALGELSGREFDAFIDGRMGSDVHAVSVEEKGVDPPPGFCALRRGCTMPSRCAAEMRCCHSIDAAPVTNCSSK